MAPLLSPLVFPLTDTSTLTTMGKTINWDNWLICEMHYIPSKAFKILLTADDHVLALNSVVYKIKCYFKYSTLLYFHSSKESIG